MASGRTENAFEVLSREEAAPEVENPAVVVTSEDVKAGLAKPAAAQEPAAQAWHAYAPPTPGRTGALPEAQPVIQPDVSKAPGDVSYAQAAKQHGEAAEGKAAERAQAGKEAAGEAAKMTQAAGGAAWDASGEAAGAAREKAKWAGAEARQLAEEAREKAGEAGQAAREQAGEAGEAARHKAGELAESAKHAAADVRQPAEGMAGAAREQAAHAGEAAREYAGAAKDKAADVALSVGGTVAQAVEYVKEHLPAVQVERQDTSPAERESQALLDEAMALATGEPMPIRVPPRETPAPAPSRPAAAEPAAPSPAAAPSAPTATSSGTEGGTAASLLDTTEPAPFHAYEPRTATEVANRATEKGAELAQAAKVKGAELMDRTRGASSEATASTREAAKEAAPDELAARMDREEQSAKGPLEALAEAVKGAADYVKQHVLPRAASPPGSPRRRPAAAEESEEPVFVRIERSRGSGRVYEYSALPGDIHPAQLGRVFREKVLHVPAATETGAAEARDTAVGGMRAAAEDVKGAAGAKYEEAKESVEGAASEARERSAGALATARDKAAEDKAKWAYQHTKDELKQSPQHWHEATVPHTPEEAAKAAGIIPSDTESLLRQKGAAAYAEHEVWEDEERNKLRTSELLDEAAAAYGEENLAPSDLRDVQEEAECAGALAGQPRGGTSAAGGSATPASTALGRLSAGAKDVKEEVKAELKEAVQYLDKREPGEGGEIPS